MAIRTWVILTALLGTVTIAIIVLAPITYTMVDMLNATGPSSGQGRTALNSAMNMVYRVVPWTSAVIVIGLWIWAFTRPQARESESYID